MSEMGKWKALEVIDTTIDETRSLLFPVRKAFWLKLALVVMVMGGFSGGGMSNYHTSGPGDFYGGDTTSTKDPEVDELFAEIEVFLTDYWLYLASGIVFFFLFIVLFTYVGDVLQFVFLRGVVEGEVQIMDWAKENLGKGLSLFVFRIAAGLAMMLLLGVASIPFIIGIAAGSGPLAILGAALGGVLFLAIIILSSVVFLGATDFVVPVMHFRDKGIWAGYKDVFTLVRKDPWQFVLYVVIRTVLSIAGGIISLMLMIPIMFVWLIIIAVLGVVVWVFATTIGLTPGNLGLMGWTLVVFTMLILGITFIYSISLVTLPVPVYLRLYSLSFILTQDDTIEGPSSSEG